MSDFKKYTQLDEMYIANDVIDYHKSLNEASNYQAALIDLKNWSSEGNLLYTIVSENQMVGFFHLGSRGEGCNWLEHLYVKKRFRNQGLGKSAIKFAEELVKNNGYDAMYIEVLPKNIEALKLYFSLGFDSLNTITIRKDFEEIPTIQEETIQSYPFKIKDTMKKGK